MYCVKCGKQIDYNAKLCKECEANETVGNQNANVAINPACIVKPTPIKEEKATQQPNSKPVGFNLALASVIMVPFALIMFAIYFNDMYYCLDNILYWGNASFVTGDLIFSSVNVVAIIVACVMGLVMTSKAHREQDNIVKNGGVRHKATFVMSIVGKVVSILALVIIGESLLSLIKLIF